MGWHRSPPRNALNPEAGMVGGLSQTLGRADLATQWPEEFGKAPTHQTPLHWKAMSNFQQNYPVSKFMVCFIHFPQPKDNVLCKYILYVWQRFITGAVVTLSCSFMHSMLVKLPVFQAKFSLFHFLLFFKILLNGNRWKKDMKNSSVLRETFLFPFYKGAPSISMDRSSTSWWVFEVWGFNPELNK